MESIPTLKSGTTQASSNLKLCSDKHKEKQYVDLSSEEDEDSSNGSQGGCSPKAMKIKEFTESKDQSKRQELVASCKC
jgi:hypothetical protein